MKTALVTGASEGIGRALVKKLTSEGYSVIAVARNEIRLRELKSECGCEYETADLMSAEGVAKISNLIAEKKFTVLINNAGLGTFGSFEKTNYDQWDKILRLNCETLTELSHAFLKTSSKGDALINISSGVSYMPMPISSVYSASKSYVTMLSECLWYEQRKRGVYVLALCPGATKSEFHARAGGNAGDIPEWAYQSAETVANIAYRALKCRRRPVVICGSQGPLIFLSRFIPRKWVILISGRVTEQGASKN